MPFERTPATAGALVPLTAPSISMRPAGPGDCDLVHDLYAAAPGYFEILSIPLPSSTEVRTELETAAADPRRRTELVLVDDAPETSAPALDPETGLRVAGYVDLTLDYLEPGDATINLLLIRADLQGQGIGSTCMRELETRLQGRVTRVLASIYGRNPGAERFWRSLGYAFAIDAAPVLEWYAKRLPA